MGSICTNADALRLVTDHKTDCELLAKQINVPIENVLGLAAQESQYGTGRIARDCNNYFSMRAPAPLQVGVETAHGDPKVKVAKYSSFLQSGQSFVQKYGNAVKGLAEPIAFAQALVDAHFNTGNVANGGRAGFEKYLADIIAAVRMRLQCKTP